METTSDSSNRSQIGSLKDEEILCVVCDQKLKRSDIVQHTEEEMQRLLRSKTTKAEATPSNIEGQPAKNGKSAGGDRKPWSVFKKVQKNRQSRLKQRTRKRVAPTVSEQACPVCNENFAQDEIQTHVEQCLRRSNGNSAANGHDSYSSEDEYEEYEWAGQKRIRTSTLLQGGYAAIGVGSNSTSAVHESEDEDLNVDEDDTRIYGPSQYDEGDVIALESDQNGTNRENDVANYMRRLITGGSSAANCSSTSNLESKYDNKSLNSSKHSVMKESTSSACDPQTAWNKDLLIDSLKVKLNHFEDQVQNKYKCLICLDEYRNPAVSVSCWHVHCEQCWLQSLGTRKLCPQCNLITTPKDLRRIYM